MKLNAKTWLWIAAILLAVIILLVFLLRNTKDPDNENGLKTAQNTAKTQPSSKRDSDGALSENGLGTIIQTTDEEKDRIEEEMRAIGKMCGKCYLRAEKIPSEYYGKDNIGQIDIDDMEDTLTKAGYCVTNSDAVYPEYLENSGSLNQFWKNVAQNRDAETTVWSISSSGSVYCRVFQYKDGKAYCIHASSDWDDAGSLYLTQLEKKEILYWDMTTSGFVFQDIYPNRHWSAAYLLRLQAVDHSLYDLTEKYISSIGYHNVNLFLLDWDSSDFGNLCFNDMLSEMHRMKYGDNIHARDYPHVDEPFPHSVIPADLFESVIFEHFNISIQEFRERALYDAENDAYPWQELCCDNILYFPELIPEVTKVTDNTDGTMTLLVNVICPDKHADHLFEHEVTLNIEPDGTFQYLSNRIVYRSENELPSPQARIKAQRFDVDG